MTETTDWLLQGPAWVRYATERQLLGKRSKADAALADDAIVEIRERLGHRERGIPGIASGALDYKTSNDEGNAYWDMFFLGDIGLTGTQLGLDSAVEGIFKRQTKDRHFPIWNGMKPNFFCISSIALSGLVRLGYGDDPRIKSHLEMVLGTQRLDGGWHCTAARAIGGRLQDAESCPMDNLNILMLLGQYPAYRTQKRLDGAIELLLTHWARQAEHWRPMGFGIGSEFLQLKYPAIKYGILRVLDVLSFYPYALKDPRFREMLSVVQAKAIAGRYTAESTVKTFQGLDFAQKKEPSRWLTFFINRIEKRLADAN